MGEKKTFTLEIIGVMSWSFSHVTKEVENGFGPSRKRTTDNNNNNNNNGNKTTTTKTTTTNHSSLSK